MNVNIPKLKIALVMTVDKKIKSMGFITQLKSCVLSLVMLSRCKMLREVLKSSVMKITIM